MKKTGIAVFVLLFGILSGQEWNKDFFGHFYSVYRDRAVEVSAAEYPGGSEDKSAGSENKLPVIGSELELPCLMERWEVWVTGSLAGVSIWLLSRALMNRIKAGRQKK